MANTKLIEQLDKLCCDANQYLVNITPYDSKELLTALTYFAFNLGELIASSVEESGVEVETPGIEAIGDSVRKLHAFLAKDELHDSINDLVNAMLDQWDDL